MRLGRRHDLDSRKIDSGVKQGSAFVLLTGHNQSCRFARCPKVDLLPTRSARPVAGKWRRSTVKAHFVRDRNLRRPRKARSSNLPMAAGSVLPNARHSRSPLEARVAGSSRWSQNRHPPTALFLSGTVAVGRRYSRGKSAIKKENPTVRSKVLASNLGLARWGDLSC